MAQKQWLIYPHSPKEHLVGIYHGEESKHFVLYVDQKILKIKFNQTGDLTISFIVEEILYEVEIKKQTTGFDYKLRSKQDELIKNYVSRKTWREKLKYWFS